jgi:hypothetical protein
MKLSAVWTITVVFLLPLGLIAQDQIFKKNKEVITCTVREVGTEEIRYNLPEYQEEVTFAIEKDKVDRIVFADGQEIVIENEMYNPENYPDDRTKAIKLDFISPLTGNTTISYEQSMRPGRSWEVSLGLIGMGIDPNNNNALGLFGQFGIKFIKSPDFYLSRMRYSHLLKGGYIKPVVSFAAYGIDRNEIYPYNVERETVLSGMIMVDFGKQWVFDNVLLFDLYAGVGYGFSTGMNSDDLDYNFGFVTGPPEVPIALEAGINLGYLLKKK